MPPLRGERVSKGIALANFDSRSTSDGFVRLPLEDLRIVSWSHLLSALDDGLPLDTRRLEVQRRISGFTEWHSETMSGPLSLGWDWLLEASTSGDIACARTGLPRTNLMLTGRDGKDIGWYQNLETLAWVIDQLPWEKVTLCLIKAGQAGR